MKHRRVVLHLLTSGLLAIAPLACGDTTPAAPEAENRAPEIGPLPTTVFHDMEYFQTVDVTDPDGDPVSVRALLLPQWMSFDTATLVLRGVAGAEGVGQHRVTLRATDGLDHHTLSFLLTVEPHLSILIDGGPWVSAGYSFGHDGEPRVSENFTVFSGFSSQAERQYVAEAMEGHFQDFKATFDIASHDELDGWVEETTIPVLTLRLQGTDVIWQGTSYRYGLIVHAPDSPRYAQAGYTRGIYDQLLRHELMHVVEYYLVGQEGTVDSVQKWFREGVAMVMGGTPPNQIQDMAAVEQWRSDMAGYIGQGNPVSVEVNGDYPAAIQSNPAVLNRYYLFFELAVRYLLDPQGLGKTPADVKNLYLSIRGGEPFPAAFQTHLGLSVDVYESEFWDFMAAYLG